MLYEPSLLKSHESNKRRIALNLQYDGLSFCGWQKQSKGVSVQSVLEEAISSLDPLRPIKAVAAGRTDARVHAAAQVVHFDACGPIPPESWPSVLNSRLPNTIRVIEAAGRPFTWHACYSAIYRRYRYTIYNGCNPNLFLAPWCWHRYQYRLDDCRMRLAMEGLIGSHDFAAFQRSGSSRAHSRTTIQEVDLDRVGDLLVLEIQASGFLYGMVRLLVGQLVAVGEHRLSLEEFESRWKERRREDVKEAAPAHGLCLLRVGYEEQLFSKVGLTESFPRFLLDSTNPPRDPLS